MDIKFCYNPFTREFFSGGLSHAEDIRKKGNIGHFDDYIRGIIVENTVYLRLYYPLKYQNKKSIFQDDYEKIKCISWNLLADYEKNIVDLIYKNLKAKIKIVKYNVDNDLLKGLKICNI